MEALTTPEAERPEIGKTFRLTPSQAQKIEEYRQREELNFTQVIDIALREFFQRRREVYPETRYRRPW